MESISVLFLLSATWLGQWGKTGHKRVQKLFQGVLHLDLSLPPDFLRAIINLMIDSEFWNIGVTESELYFSVKFSAWQKNF